MTTLFELKNGATLPNPIYKVHPYVILAKNEIGGLFVIETHESIISLLKERSYYDKCIVKIREHDLYMNDNTKI
jgi:hypothetical protein